MKAGLSVSGVLCFLALTIVLYHCLLRTRDMDQKGLEQPEPTLANNKLLIRTERYEKPEMTGHPSRFEMNGIPHASEAMDTARVEIDTARQFAELPG